MSIHHSERRHSQQMAVTRKRLKEPSVKALDAVLNLQQEVKLRMMMLFTSIILATSLARYTAARADTSLRQIWVFIQMTKLLLKIMDIRLLS
jgi:hypothetical protein